MMDETLSRGDSLMHRSHPAIRVVMATLYSFTVALMHDRLGLAMALGFSMGLWALAALPLRTMVKRLTAAGGLLVLIWLVQVGFNTLPMQESSE